MSCLRHKLILKMAANAICTKYTGDLPVRAEVLEALQEGGQQLQSVAVLYEYANL